MKDGSEGLSIFIWLAFTIFALLLWVHSMSNWMQDDAREVIRQQKVEREKP